MIVIGNKNIFLELDESERNIDLVPLRLCIEGQYLGTLESATYLPGFIGSLNNVLKDEYYYSELINNDNYKYFFYPNSIICEDFRVTLEETFDDFSKRVARNKEAVYFTWFLYPEHYFEYTKNSIDQVFFAQCSYIELSNLVENLWKWFKTIKVII